MIAPSVGDLPVMVDPDLGEHEPGPECDGLTFDEFVARYGKPDWDTDPYATTFPGGETVAEFQHRVGVALHRVALEHDGRTVMVVCHGGVIDRALRLFLHTTSTGQFQIRTVNASLTEFVRVQADLWRLLRYNDAAHLAGLPDETPRG